MIYLIFFLFLFFLNTQNKKRNDNLYSWIIAIVYILLVGLRGPSVGVDTENYYDYFNMFGAAGTGYLEAGFETLISFCHKYGLPAYTHLLICAVLTVIPVMLAVNKLNKKPHYIFCLIFFTMSFGPMCNIMRQCVAIAWIFYAICRLSQIEKLTIKEAAIYTLLIFFASQFHASSLILLPFILMKIVHLDRKIYLIIYLLFFSAYFVQINTLLTLLPDISFLTRDFTGYLDSTFALGKSRGLGFIISLIANIITFIIIYRLNAFKKYPMIANAAFLNLCFQHVSNNFIIFARITIIFQYFVWLVLALLYSDLKKESKDIQLEYVAFKAVFSIYAVLTVYGFLSDQNALLPYKFYFE